MEEFVGILMILAWVAFGNTIYEGEHNWFFIEKSIFPFLADEIMPPVVVGCVFRVCLVVYGVYYGVRAIASKKNMKIA
ncbi:MAG: hypothetical protein E7448_00590 [Ruminococcaceae bacterium]|nr:hypothetical protein [Oscillospiraceae bacterium]